MRLSGTRKPALAGRFYPADGGELARSVDALFARAARPSGHVRAFMTPHAGYVYSGQTAAAAWAPARSQSLVRRIILLGPSHRVYLRGIALPQAARFSSPLGAIELDADALAELAASPLVSFSAEAHRLEHSLETQLPFLQRSLGKRTRLAPLLIGESDPVAVADLLEPLIDPETLVVASSDLSHFLTYDVATEQDQATLAAITDRRADLTGGQACGHRGLNVLATLAHRFDWNARQVAYRNSGDVSGDLSRVVGYGAVHYV